MTIDIAGLTPAEAAKLARKAAREQAKQAAERFDRATFVGRCELDVKRRRSVAAQ